MGPKILGVIPARGGSKGIKGKNIYPLAGHPLISYTIQSAQKSACLNQFIVSTDSEEIATLVREYGAQTPFIRPAHLSSDSALAIDVMKHAILEIEKIDKIQYDFLVMLQPTTPLKVGEDIDKAVDKLIRTGCDTVISMVDVGANHPTRMYTIEDDQLVSVMDEGISLRPRQELPSIYIRNGAIYACKREILFEYNSLIGPDCRPYVMPLERSVNIDCITDMILAEYLIQKHETED